MRLSRMAGLVLALLLAPGLGSAAKTVVSLPSAHNAAVEVEPKATPRMPSLQPSRSFQLPELSTAERAGFRAAQEGPALQVGVGRPTPSGLAALDLAALNWSPLDDGSRAALIDVESTGAVALRLGLKAAAIPAGLQVSFYGKEAPGLIHGPYTRADAVSQAGENGLFWSPVLGGSVAFVIVRIPADFDVAGQTLQLPYVSHVVETPRHPRRQGWLGNVGASGSCNIDVACHGNWSDSASGVAKYFYVKGNGLTFMCTGSLINHAGSVGGQPPYYFISANHCMDSQAVASTAHFFWHFQRAACGGAAPTSVQETFGGGTLLRSIPANDTILLRLTNPPAGNAIRLGWTTASVGDGTGITGIHHPRGDLKKISFGTKSGYWKTTMNGDGSFYSQSSDFDNGTDIGVAWSQGVLEGGSSGSALLNGSGQIVGTLRGGGSSCETPDKLDFYGRFDRAFPEIRSWLYPDVATDTTPDPFSFAPKTGVTPGAFVESAPVTISGINAAATVSVSGGFVRIAGGNWVTSGTVSNGQTVQAGHYASASYGTSTTMTVTIGGVSATFTSTTASGGGGTDTTPNPFSFATRTGVSPLAWVESDPVTISGINAAASVSVSGGMVRIAGGNWTTSGTITNGQTIQAAHYATSSNGGTTVTTVIIGGVSATFTSVTASGGTDDIPNAFSFAPRIGVPALAWVESAAVTITGINTGSGVSVSNGYVSINGGAWASSGTIFNGQSIRVAHSAGAGAAESKTSTVTIGGVSATFTSTTVGGGLDDVPNAFSFATRTGVTALAWVESAAVTITGINTGASVSASNGYVSINGGAWASSGTIFNGQSIRVAHTAGAGAAESKTSTVTIGGVSATFTSMTVGGGGGVDTTPDPFSFGTRTGVSRSTWLESGVATITGINAGANVIVSNGYISINGGAWSSSGTVFNGQSVRLAHTTGAAAGESKTSLVIIGGVSATFTSVTAGGGGGDTTPDAFSFAPRIGVSASAWVESAPVTITGINAGATVAASNGYVSINGSAWTSSGTVFNGQTVRVAHTSAPAAGASKVSTVNIGGVTGTFTSTTAGW